MNQFRVVNFGSTILATLLGALLLLVCLKFPVWGIIQVERKFEVYHFVSRDTVATLDEMSATLGDFGEACEAHQAAERDLLILGDCTMVTVSGDKSCEDLRLEAQTDVEQATADMYKAVAARKAKDASVALPSRVRSSFCDKKASTQCRGFSFTPWIVLACASPSPESLCGCAGSWA